MSDASTAATPSAPAAPAAPPPATPSASAPAAPTPSPAATPAPQAPAAAQEATPSAPAAAPPAEPAAPPSGEANVSPATPGADTTDAPAPNAPAGEESVAQGDDAAPSDDAQAPVEAAAQEGEPAEPASEPTGEPDPFHGFDPAEIFGEEFVAEGLFYKSPLKDKGGSDYKDPIAAFKSIPHRERALINTKAELEAARQELESARSEGELKGKESQGQQALLSAIAEKLGTDSPEFRAPLVNQFVKDYLPDDMKDLSFKDVEGDLEKERAWLKAEGKAERAVDDYFSEVQGKAEAAENQRKKAIEDGTKRYQQYVTPEFFGAEGEVEREALRDFLSRETPGGYAREQVLHSYFAIDEETAQHTLLGMKVAFNDSLGRGTPVPAPKESQNATEPKAPAQPAATPAAPAEPTPDAQANAAETAPAANAEPAVRETVIESKPLAQPTPSTAKSNAGKSDIDLIREGRMAQSGQI